MHGSILLTMTDGTPLVLPLWRVLRVEGADDDSNRAVVFAEQDKGETRIFVVKESPEDVHVLILEIAETLTRGKGQYAS